MTRRLINSMALATLWFNVAYAQIIKNGSFEIATVNPGSSGWIGVPPGSPAITGWTVTDGSIDYIGTLWTAYDGKRSIDLNSSVPGSISQSFTTIQNEIYQVQFALAGNPDSGPSLKTLRVSVAGSSREFTFNTSGMNRQNMGWQKVIFKFTAISTVTTLTFTSLVSGAYGPAIDTVRVDFSTFIEETPDIIPFSFVLHQNYPNPFSARETLGNPSTTIVYDLPRAGEVEITIFNLLGERVRTLVKQRQAAGQYRIQWDGRNENGKSMPSGVYLYRLRAGEFVQTRKMILAQ